MWWQGHHEGEVLHVGAVSTLNHSHGFVSFFLPKLKINDKNSVNQSVNLILFVVTQKQDKELVTSNILIGLMM